MTNTSILVDGTEYSVSELTVFGFVAKPKIQASSGKISAILRLNGEQVEIDARIRKSDQLHSKCRFTNLSIMDKRVIQGFLEDQSRVVDGELDAQSYDELASGISDSPAANGAAVGRSRRPSTRFKSLAMLGMVFLLAGLAVLALMFLRSRSSLVVNNASMVGNFLPVNAKVQGEISDLFVTEGQQVNSGDLLMRLKNPQIESACIQAKAACDSATAKVIALERQQQNYQQKLQVAAEKLVLDLEVAKSELRWAQKVEKAAIARVKRLVKYVKSGAITQLEYEEAQQEKLAAEAQVIAAESLMKRIKFSKKQIDNGILILGDRLDDELGRITADLEIARSELEELKVVYKEVSGQARQLEIKAPRDGQIYSNYRQTGEFVKVADEAVALSYPGETWAIGHVSPGQASRVRPGQPVSVSFPSLNCTLDGVVLAVGHRSIYSKGGYNADFRGLLASDVPVKVRVPNLPDDIPSGMRVEMAISTGFGLKWLDEAMGYKLQPLTNEKMAARRQEKVMVNPRTQNETVGQNIERKDVVMDDSTTP